ncbi:MAG: helix-turn-helix transcriptional regulator [Lachnospiraceae bacterium]|nr:helix-turn-helix transcriptional regulator [Lachnospiraceae bacterium]
MQFNERLKNMRKRSKVTQKSISEHLGVTLRTYQRYEEGTIEPPLATVSAIADYFGVPVDCLIGNGIFSNWDEILLHREQILLFLGKEVLSFPDGFDLSTLTEGILARILPALFAKITFNGPEISIFPLLPVEAFPLSISSDGF